jgi:TolA-binding protein
VHDFLRKEFESYAKNDEWEVSLLNSLKKVESHKIAAERADALGKSATSTDGKLAALRFSVSSRILLLKLPSTPDWNPKRQINPNTDIVNTFIDATAQLSQAGVPENEGELARSLAIYAAVLSNQDAKASTIFEENSKKYPKGKHSADAASFLINNAINNSDEAEKEKILRIAVNAKITPSDPEHKSPRAMLEESIWGKAERQRKNNQLEVATTTYAAFQEEFPASRNAPSALRKAADASLADKKTDKGLGYLELLIETYPRSDLIMEARWQAGTLAESMEQKERGADHFVLFAQKYTGEGLSRNAWFRAAALYEKSGNTDKAVQAYESYVAQAPSPRQKIDGLQAEVRVLRSKGQSEQALAALNRMGEIAKGLTGDEVEEVTLGSMVQSLEILKESGRHAEAQKIAVQLTTSQPRSESGLASVARGNFMLGEYRMELLRERLAAPNFIIEHEKVMELYTNTENALLSICEVPGQPWCSAAYYEVSAMAQRVSQALTAALPPATTEGADPIRTAIEGYLVLLEKEKTVFAEQAVDALNSIGAPNSVYQEKIAQLSTANKPSTPKN